MAKPQRPNTAYVVNGWYFELPGLISPHFETLSGLNKKTGTVEIVDGGTNVKYKFASQIIDFGQITLSRTRDGSIDDRALNLLVDSSIRIGSKFAGVLVKLHFGVEVFRIAFEGLRFAELNHPDYNTLGEDKLLMQYMATVDGWVEI